MTTQNFTKLPNEIFQLYTKIPGFKGEHALMYAVLVSYHNEEYGYAFPDQAELQLRLNVGVNAPGRIAKKLKECGLIDYKRTRAGSNYVYYVYDPIKSPEEFYDTFPEAKTNYDDRFDKVAERKRKTDSENKVRDKGDEGEVDFYEWL